MVALVWGGYRDQTTFLEQPKRQKHRQHLPFWLAVHPELYELARLGCVGEVHVLPARNVTFAGNIQHVSTTSSWIVVAQKLEFVLKFPHCFCHCLLSGKCLGSYGATLPT